MIFMFIVRSNCPEIIEQYHKQMSHSRCNLQPIGRLGNHLFQVAALLREKIVRHKQIHIFVDQNQHYYDGFLYKLKQFITDVPTSNNGGGAFRYTPIHTTTTVLNGYFQSSRYFSDISNEVRDWFDPHPSIKSTVSLKYATLLTDEIRKTHVIVHVRRGDYVIPSKIRFHGILTPLYYCAAMARMREMCGSDVRFLLFSDDIEYCRTTFTDSDIICLDEPDEMVTLHLMSQFNHYILSNSSFSWWAVYLGEPSQIVIAPDRWFGPAGPQDIQDIYEPGWIRMRAE